VSRLPFVVQFGRLNSHWPLGFIRAGLIPRAPALALAARSGPSAGMIPVRYVSDPVLSLSGTVLVQSGCCPVQSLCLSGVVVARPSRGTGIGFVLFSDGSADDTAPEHARFQHKEHQNQNLRSRLPHLRRSHDRGRARL
jgi:hypothetical protein